MGACQGRTWNAHQTVTLERPLDESITAEQHENMMRLLLTTASVSTPSHFQFESEDGTRVVLLRDHDLDGGEEHLIDGCVFHRFHAAGPAPVARMRVVRYVFDEPFDRDLVALDANQHVHNSLDEPVHWFLVARCASSFVSVELLGERSGCVPDFGMDATPKDIVCSRIVPPP